MFVRAVQMTPSARKSLHDPLEHLVHRTAALLKLFSNAVQASQATDEGPEAIDGSLALWTETFDGTGIAGEDRRHLFAGNAARVLGLT